MKVKSLISCCCGMLVLLACLAEPAAARVFFQCPGYVPGVDLDNNPADGMLRAADGEISNPLDAVNQVCVHLAAGDGFVSMADAPTNPGEAAGRGQDQYMFGFVNVTGAADADVMKLWSAGGGVLAATFPAPTLRFREGDKVYLTLTNVGMMMRPDLFDPHTVHWHGFPNASAIFDGVPDASLSINMGSSLTYFYHVVEPGTFMYHCHVEATEHMQMGMLGNLHVTPNADGFDENYVYKHASTAFTPGRDFSIQILAFDPVFHNEHIAVQPLPFAHMVDTYPMLNGRGYPETVNPAPLANNEGYAAQVMPALITANAGDQVLVRFSSLSTTSFHTLTSSGIPMRVVGRGSRILRSAGATAGAQDLSYTTSQVTLGGGQAIDVILDTTGVPAGTYFLYTTNLDHLSNDKEDFGGMMTEIVLN